MPLLVVFNATVASAGDPAVGHRALYVDIRTVVPVFRLRGSGMTLDAKGQALDLAVIGNCRTAALVDAGGRIVWCAFRVRFRSGFLATVGGRRRKGLLRRHFGWAYDVGGGVSAQHRDRGDNHSRRSGNAVRITDFTPSLQTLRAHLQPPPALSPDRADCRSAAHQDQSSSHVQLWPAVRQQGDGLESHPLRRRRRNIAPHDGRTALLYRTGVVVCVDQACHTYPGS